MFPLRDHNRPQATPFFTYGLIAANLLVFFYQAGLSERGEAALVREMGLKPAFVVGYLRGEETAVIEEVRGVRVRGFSAEYDIVRRPVPLDFWNSLFPFLASMFLHGGLAHLLGNLWFLHIFGDNVEDRLGHGRFLAFYLTTGIAASLGQIVVSPDSSIPCVGASGAISGVLGGYALAFPRARVVTLVPIWFFLQILEIPAFVFLFIWFGIQVASGLYSSPGMAGVAWWAHIGGFVAGAAWMWLQPPRRRRPSRYGRERDVPFWMVE